MAKTFMGKDGVLYNIQELTKNQILENSHLLQMYTMQEFDMLYKKYFGVYEHTYLDILKKKNQLYGSSIEINSFLYNNISYWFSKDIRTTLYNLATHSLDDLQIVLGNLIIPIHAIQLQEFIMQLEKYAYECFITTFKHQQNILKLNTIEEIINYDYTTGYPEKIILE